MNTTSYGDFSRRVHSFPAGSRVLLDAGIDLTYRCNNACVHCYCNLPASDEEARNEELSTAEVTKLLDDLASMGCLWLLLTGGEPFLRRDFAEVYLYAKKKGFLITLFTNGTLVDDAIVALLSRYRPFAVEITLYGATRGTYELVSGVKGSFDRCMAGIHRIAGAGIKLKLKTMAMTLNVHELEAMDKVARDLGCEFRFDPLLNMRIDNSGLSRPNEYRLPAEQVTALDRMFPGRMEEYRKFCEKFVHKPEKSDKLFRCGAGQGSIHINPYGLAKGCLMMSEGFSLREHSLDWIWETGIPSVTDARKNFSLPCDDCSLVNLCGQCAPWSILEHGDARKEVAYLCEVAKMRGRDFEFIKDK